MKKYIKEKIRKNIYAKGKTYKKISLSLVLNDNTHSLTIYIPSQYRYFYLYDFTLELKITFI